LRRAIRNAKEVADEERYPMLFDPQTAGGLLASVSAAGAESCLEELRRTGYLHAAIVGEVKLASEDLPPVTVRC
jgi:selenide,water dikinase